MTQPFRLSGFNPGYFRRLLEAVNPTLGRWKESSFEPLLAITDRMTLGQTFNALTKEAVQEIVFFIPHDKQQKYKKALDYLVESAGVKLARPANPGMEFSRFAVGIFPYVAANGQAVSLDPGSFHHEFTFTWKSSNGDLQSLRQVGTRE